MKKLVVLLLTATVVITVCKKSDEQAKFSNIKLRLQWVPQAQFAGYLVAKEKGFYKERNLDVEILPAGPDLKPHTTVASGTDDIGIGVPNQIIAARSNNVPLVVISQIFQDSANRYVLKAKNKINDLRELKGTKVGLWLGGDEVEFIAMLKTVGMTMNDIVAVPQEFSVVPFLEDQYVLSQVTVYNELNLIRAQGYEGDKLQVLSPKDYNSAIVGDMIFCMEDFLKKNKEVVAKFLEASILGWKYCLENPNDAVEIVVKYNPELNREEQTKQLTAVLKLIWFGKAKEMGIGFVNEDDYVIAEKILYESKQIDRHVDAQAAYDLSAWQLVSTDALKPTNIAIELAN